LHSPVLSALSRDIIRGEADMSILNESVQKQNETKIKRNLDCIARIIKASAFTMQRQNGGGDSETDVDEAE
jgi:hypothetical protein